ncbi:SCP2 sterol-binding domain-containing protein [Verrucomicrobium sp. BvORR106]|uniref:SCP2 sterol-binding domain-containing protein n=1 Tax=Verrucomicrobium sp. BvORR106 TaxID=1403819 RepID=UPI000571AE41|nr:SCP2 sterol-binding domain-containing protein [Verrucomicrobium sp. BvORR106]
MSSHSDESSTSNTPAELFNTRVAEKTESPELQALVNATFRFDLSGPQGGSWLVDFRPGSAGVRPAEEEGTCTFSMKDQDFVALLAGKLNPRMAFMMGTLKVKGDMTVAMKLGQALGAA